MGKKIKVKIGDVFEIKLPNSKFAYGRVYNDAAVGIYQDIMNKPNSPPIGSRHFIFIVGMYKEILTSGEFPIIDRDPFDSSDDEWPPPSYIKDLMSGEYKIYHKGKIRESSYEECRNLEETAVWDSQEIIERIINSSHL